MIVFVCAETGTIESIDESCYLVSIPEGYNLADDATAHDIVFDANLEGFQVLQIVANSDDSVSLEVQL
jgi:hypothetical protein